MEKMDDEVSAFAAYAAKKPKKKSQLEGFKIKPKYKLKKKKSKIHTFNSEMKELEPSEVAFAKDKNTKKNPFNEKESRKTKPKTQEQSLFENCLFTSTMDNVFLNTNGFCDDEETKEKFKRHSDYNTEVKKVKKRKIDGEEQSKIKEDVVLNGTSGKLITSQGSKLVMSDGFDNKKKKLKEMGGKYKSPDLIYSDSTKVGEEIFSWLISPLELNEFFKDCWEQKPLHIKHNDENYFKYICTMEDFKTALRDHDMYFTKNIDVTSYIDGVRNTENPEGKAKPSTVWDFYRNGRSIRLLNPQTFIPNIRMLNSFLQEFFQCFVGANIYLTPPGTQGFAPHYDDIEAFVLQLEGEKHWKLYNPRSQDEILPRESSKNFTEDEIGDPILEVTLQPGDLLYFPRGIIHQAKCLPHVHSLHVTVSCYQKNSWADLLEKVLPVALQAAISENVEFRKGLPIGYLSHLGMVHYDQESTQRQDLIKTFEKLVQKVLEYCPLDAGVDQLGANFMHDALPPYLTSVEKLYGGDRDNKDINKCLLEALKIYPDRNLGLKLIRANCIRLVSEEDELMLYYTTDNSLVYHEQEPVGVSVPVRWAQAIDQLIRSYPKFIEMKDLPVSEKVNKPGKWRHIAEFVYFLWQKGLVLFDKPLQQLFS